MNFRLLIALLAILIVARAHAQVPPPIIAVPGQEIIYRGNFGDEVMCDGKRMGGKAFFSIQVIQEKCDCAGGFSYKVYEDGILKGKCSEEPEKLASGDINTFINLPVIDHLSDKELLKLASAQQIGTCKFYFEENLKGIFVEMKPADGRSYLSISLSKAPNEVIRSIQDQNAHEMGLDKFNEKVRAKTVRDTLNADVCGKFSQDLIDSHMKEQNNILGSNDIAFDYIASLGASADDMIDMGYPVKKLRDHFNLKAEDFKRHGISAWYMRSGGFTVAELKDGRYPLSDIMNGGYDVAHDVKPNFSASEFKSIGTSTWYMRSYGFTVSELKSGGYPLSDIMNGGYDVSRDVKPNYTAANFRDLGTSTWYMRSYGFTVKELKSGGYPLSDIMNGGFDMKDITREFSARDLKGLGTTTWYMRSYGYSVSDLKAAGYALSDIMNGGYDVSRDIKPNFTASDFKNLGTSTWYMRSYGFTVRDLKGIYSLSDIMNGGYDVARDIKPNYSASELRSLGTSAWYMRSYGYSARELYSAGYSKDDLRNAGFSNAEIDNL